MSSPRYATPLTLEPQPSRWLLFLTLFLHTGAVFVSLQLAALPWPLRLLLFTAVVLSLWQTLGKLGWRQTPAHIQRLLWQADNDWQLTLHNGDVLSAELRPASFLHPWLVVLSLRVEGQRLPRTVVLARDSLDETPFRQLRVRLTTEAGKLFGET